MNILDKIAESTRKRVEAAKQRVPAEEMKQAALAMPARGFEFEKALKKPGVGFICECKKASPSKGLIAENFPYLDIAKEYEAAGADCISVLTEPEYFLGSTEYLREIAAAVKTPCIRKDFVIDEYMIYEARTLGASAVLLICSLLGEDMLREYIGICDKLGLSALVEAHDADEVREALSAGARVVGVNNRNLKDFSVSTDNAVNLRKLVPEGIVFVAESGIKTAEDVAALRAAGVDAVLVGETLMRAEDKAAALAGLKGETNG
ncbi:MAG: indole-3-glycerol phosphate synthase TrpC [Ruminiclostridium sp.]|nr:indole-3-glycerol phosphate synthase TrpC [Ruminiclostridium sp.]